MTILAQIDEEETAKGAERSSQRVETGEKSEVEDGNGRTHFRRDGQLSVPVSQTQRSQAG